MKSKLLPALLLSLAVIAGTTTITTDALAQETTNTDRLISVIATTSDTNSIVHALETLLADVMSQVSALVDAVSMLNEDVTAANQAVTSKLNTIEGSLDGLATSADVQRVMGVVDDINAAVMDNADAIDEVTHHTVDEVVNEVVNELDKAITPVATQVNNLDKRLTDIEGTLASITEELNIVQETVAPTDAPATLPALMSDIEDGKVTARHYAEAFKGVHEDKPYETTGLNPKEGTLLSLAFDFKCDENVLIRDVDVTPAGPMFDITTNPSDPSPSTAATAVNPLGDTRATAEKSFVKVGSSDLINTQFDLGTTKALYDQPKDYELMQLPAGQSLKFTSEIAFALYDETRVDPYDIDAPAVNTKYYGQHDPDNDPAVPENLAYLNLTSRNATLVDAYNFDIYEVDVDYISLTGSTPNCVLDIPDPEFDPDLVEKNLLEPIPAAGEPGELIRSFSAILDCNGITTEIREVANVRVSHGVESSAISVANLVLEADGQKVAFKLNKAPSEAVTLAPKNELPLSFTGNMTITGQVPQKSGILLGLDYFTLKNNSCTLITE